MCLFISFCFFLDRWILSIFQSSGWTPYCHCPDQKSIEKVKELARGSQDTIPTPGLAQRLDNGQRRGILERRSRVDAEKKDFLLFDSFAGLCGMERSLWALRAPKMSGDPTLVGNAHPLYRSLAACALLHFLGGSTKASRSMVRLLDLSWIWAQKKSNMIQTCSSLGSQTSFRAHKTGGALRKGCWLALAQAEALWQVLRDLFKTF